MKLVDLSHTISPRMPAYPGTSPPVFTTPCTIANTGFNERMVILYSHTGTHVDAPAHIIPGGKTLDQISADNFVGKSSVLDLAANKKSTIEIVDLESYQSFIEKSEFILLHTGWCQLWGKKGYFQGYPLLSHEAAKWVSSFNLKGLGVDTISVDEVGSTAFPIHRILLERNIIVVENLTNLNILPLSGFIFSCLPLNLEEGDGSPVRAVAIIE